MKYSAVERARNILLQLCEKRESWRIQGIENSKDKNGECVQIDFRKKQNKNKNPRREQQAKQEERYLIRKD